LTRGGVILVLFPLGDVKGLDIMFTVIKNFNKKREKRKRREKEEKKKNFGMS
jgi:hypothetical protein